MSTKNSLACAHFSGTGDPVDGDVDGNIWTPGWLHAWREGFDDIYGIPDRVLLEGFFRDDIDGDGGHYFAACINLQEFDEWVLQYVRARGLT